MTHVIDDNLINNTKMWDEKINQLIKLHNSDKPTIEVPSHKRSIRKPNPYYIQPVESYNTFCKRLNSYIDNRSEQTKINEYNQYRYSYYVRSLETIQKNIKKQIPQSIPIQPPTPVPIVQPPIPTPIVQTQAMLLETHVIIKDLQSKLDEQLKLNETLCKRLFELK